jgi:hypothetical protein
MGLSKSVTATKDFGVDWTNWLGSDTIATSSWTVPAGITEVTRSNTTKITTIWLSGGTLGTAYTLTNTITTAGGRSETAQITISIVAAIASG